MKNNLNLQPEELTNFVSVLKDAGILGEDRKEFEIFDGCVVKVGRVTPRSIKYYKEEVVPRLPKGDTNKELLAQLDFYFDREYAREWAKHICVMDEKTLAKFDDEKVFDEEFAWDEFISLFFYFISKLNLLIKM